MSKLSRIQKISIAAVMAIAVAVPVAIAQSTDTGASGRGGHWGDHGGRGGFGMGFRNLDLTDAQKAQMKQIRESHSGTIRPIMEQLHAKRQEIRQASEGGTFDEALVTQKLTEIAPLEAKLQGEQVRIHQEMLAVLTPDQKTKLEQARQELKSKWADKGAKKQKSNK